MTIGYKKQDFARSSDGMRRPYTKPVLELLEPGSAKYERARAAFSKVMDLTKFDS